MKKAFFVSSSIAFMMLVALVSSCGPAAPAIATVAASGLSTLYNQGTGVYTSIAGSMTHYEFDLVDVSNDGGIASGNTECGHSDKKTPIVYSDDMINFSFRYVDNCLLLGLKSNTNKYLTINWNDLALDEVGKLKWKEADSGASGVSTITKAAYNEANLYTYYDKRNGFSRTFEVFSSPAAADKKGYVGKTFVLNVPIIQGDTVITYRIKLKIASITVEK